MKTSTIFFCLLSFILLNCSPKNEEVTEEQIEIGDASEVLDTITSARKDAVKTDENNITPTLPLPQPILQLLTERYPGWEEPAYTPAVQNAASGNEQGPGIVRGDFNKDNLQDYALQILQQENLLLVAVLDAGNGNWQLYELSKEDLSNNQDKLKSPYLLQVTEEGTALEDQTTGKETTAPYQAIRVILEGAATVYVYENGKFKAYKEAE